MGWTESFVATMINLHPVCDGIALDIGAHVGDYTKMLSEKFAKVYAFEPFPDNIEILKNRFANTPNVTIVPKAVSKKTGVEKLYLNNVSSEGSLSTMMAQLRSWGFNEKNFMEVETITLDDFCKDMDISFMKVDAEGAENFLFYGAIKTLQRNIPWIVMECHKVVDYDSLSGLFYSLNYNFMDTEFQEVDILTPGNHFFIYKGSISVEWNNPPALGGLPGEGITVSKF